MSKVAYVLVLYTFSHKNIQKFLPEPCESNEINNDRNCAEDCVQQGGENGR